MKPEIAPLHDRLERLGEQKEAMLNDYHKCGGSLQRLPELEAKMEVLMFVKNQIDARIGYWHKKLETIQNMPKSSVIIVDHGRTEIEAMVAELEEIRGGN